MSRTKIFGDRQTGVVSVIEAPVSQFYAHRARIAFYVTAVTVWVLAVAVLSLVLSLPAAIALGWLLGIVCGFGVAVTVRAWPVLRAVWWWSAEITAAALLMAASLWLSRISSPLVPPAVVVIVAGVVAVVRPVRRRVVAWVWCGLVRHRLRMCFAQFIRTTGRPGPAHLPLILLARPTPAGARAWAWLRPGLDLTDLEGRTSKLAVACWAGEVRVVRASPRYAALLRFDIARRDPLTGLVASPLADLFRDEWQATVPVSPGMPPLNLDLDDVPEPLDPPRPSRR